MSYRAIYDSKGLLAEFDGGKLTFAREEQPEKSGSIQVIPDIPPYRNMIDGKIVGSRREHRELLKRHGCVEIGNEKMESKPIAPNTDARRRLLANQLWDMSDRQADRILRDIRNTNRV